MSIELEPPEGYDSPPPELDNLEDLDYHVRRVREGRAELEVLEQSYRRELDRIQARLESRRRVIEGWIAWHLAPVESWHRAHPATRTIELPHGTLKLTVPKSLKVFIGPDDTDREAVRSWAVQSHPEILGDPLVTKVRACVLIVDGRVVDAETGEIVPGVVAKLPAPSWSLDTEPGEPF